MFKPLTILAIKNIVTSISTVINYLDSIAPPSLQESYDNSGLIVGDLNSEIKGVLVCLDSTEEIINEAISKNCNLVIAHHPIIFKGLKKITGKNYVERTILTSIKNDIAIYAIHTNLDNIDTGVNRKICDRIGLSGTRILSPKEGQLKKLITFVPKTHQDNVLKALFDAGAGDIGLYENCAFTTEGMGQFSAKEKANPFIGKPGISEKLEETRIEVILDSFRWHDIELALKNSHPYEEVAYYLTDLKNENHRIGSGMLGELDREMTTDEFLTHLKKTMHISTIKFTKGSGSVKKVAVCGGAGSFLISKAKSAGADAFVTGDIKYHEFFDAEKDLLLADIGHYESEVFTKDLIHELLTTKFTTFAVNLAETDTNPISYF